MNLVLIQKIVLLYVKTVKALENKHIKLLEKNIMKNHSCLEFEKHTLHLHISSFFTLINLVLSLIMLLKK